LCIEELVLTLNAIREKEDRDRKFLAAIQGIDLEAEKASRSEDITSIKGGKAAKEGFGIGMGLGHVVQGE